MAAQIGSLSVKLGLVTLEWDQATEKAKKQAKDLQNAFNELGDKLKSVNEIWKTLGGSIGVGAIGFSALLQQTMEFSNQIKDLSQAYDLTISQTLSFREALMGAGVSADSASRIMSTLFSKIEDGRKGTDATLAQFEKIGISFQDLQKLTPYEMIKKVYDGLTNISNTYARVKLVKDLLGRAGIGVSVEEVSAILEKGSSSFDKYGDSIQQMAKVNENLKKSYENLKIAFSQMIAPFTRDAVVSVEKFQAILASIAAAATVTGIVKVGAALFEVGKAIQGIVAGTIALNLAMGAESPLGVLVKAASVLAGLVAYNEMMRQPTTVSNSPSGMSASIDKYDEADKKAQEDWKNREQKNLDGLSKEAQAKQSQLELTQKLIALDYKKQELEKTSLFDGQSANKISIEQLDLQEKIAQINAKRKQELETQKNATSELKAIINSTADAEIVRAQNASKLKQALVAQTAEYENQVKTMQSYGETGMEYEQETLQAQRDQIDARQKQIGQLMAQLRDEERLADLSNKKLDFENSILMTLPAQKERLMAEYELEEKIAEFRRTADLKGMKPEQIDAYTESMRTAGQETINLNQKSIELQRTTEFGLWSSISQITDDAQNNAKQAQKSVDSIYANMNNAIDNFVKTGKLNFKSFAQSVIQDLIAIQLKAQATSLLSKGLGLLGIGGTSYTQLTTGSGVLNQFNPDVDWRASGGPVNDNSPYIVGEQGPELFVPKSSGTIVPNGSLSSMGSTTNVTNYNISAIDTKSFEDRIYGSANAIWAANTYAQKNLAINRSRT